MRPSTSDDRQRGSFRRPHDSRQGGAEGERHGHAGKGQAVARGEQAEGVDGPAPDEEEGRR